MTALRRTNLSGVPPTGGVLAAVGDDPECKSSTVPSSTEWTLADLAMPTLAAATVQEVLDLGRHGYELSRRSGSWVGLKLHSDVADGYATVDVGRPMPEVAPYDATVGAGPPTSTTGCFAPWSMLLEEEAVGARLDAVHHYVRGAGLDVVHGNGAACGSASSPPARPTVTSSNALTDLGIELGDLPALGIRVLKPALVWPLEPTIVRAFAAGLHEIVVVEEKRAFLEEQVKSLLYGTVDAAVVTGRARSRRRAPRPLRRRARRHRRRGGAAEPAGAAPRSRVPATGSRQDRRRGRSPGPHAVLLLRLPAQRLDVVPEGDRSRAAGSAATAWSRSTRRPPRRAARR